MCFKNAYIEVNVEVWKDSCPLPSSGRTYSDKILRSIAECFNVYFVFADFTNEDCDDLEIDDLDTHV